MSETLIAAIVGGLIATVPTVISAISQSRQTRMQFKQEQKLKAIEFYELPRRDAIFAYKDATGKLMACDKVNIDAISAYMSAFERACLFVSDETRKLMVERHVELLHGSFSAGPVFINDLTRYPSSKVLNDALQKEINEMRNALYKGTSIAAIEIDTNTEPPGACEGMPNNKSDKTQDE